MRQCSMALIHNKVQFTMSWRRVVLPPCGHLLALVRSFNGRPEGLLDFGQIRDEIATALQSVAHAFS